MSGWQWGYLVYEMEGDRMNEPNEPTTNDGRISGLSTHSKNTLIHKYIKKLDDMKRLRADLAIANELAATRGKKLDKLYGERNRLNNIVEARDARIAELEGDLATARDVLRAWAIGDGKEDDDEKETG